MKISKWGVTLLALMMWAAAPAPGAAQAVDSVAIRLRQSLRRLQRSPAPDTAAMSTADSLAASAAGARGANPITVMIACCRLTVALSPCRHY